MLKSVELVEIKSFVILAGLVDISMKNFYETIQAELQKLRKDDEFKVEVIGNSFFCKDMVVAVLDDEMKKKIINLFFDFQKDKINYEPRITEKFVIEVKIKKNLPFIFINEWQKWKAQRVVKIRCIEHNNFRIKSPNIVLDPFSYCRMEIDEYSEEHLSSFPEFVRCFSEENKN